MRARPALVVAVATAAVVSLSACSPPAAGMLALAVRDGHLVVLARSCDAPLVDLWITGDDAADGFLERRSWKLDAPDGGIAELDLGPVDDVVAELDPDIVYSIRAWTSGSSGEAKGPAVTADQLTGWGDDVLYPADGVPLEHATGSVEEFSAAAC
jgi:hypothetical protein